MFEVQLDNGDIPGVFQVVEVEVLEAFPCPWERRRPGPSSRWGHPDGQRLKARRMVKPMEIDLQVTMTDDGQTEAAFDHSSC